MQHSNSTKFGFYYGDKLINGIDGFIDETTTTLSDLSIPTRSIDDNIQLYYKIGDKYPSCV